MVYFARSILGAAAFITAISAAPMPKPEDSAIGAEVAVSAPNGIVLSDLPTSTAEAIEVPAATEVSLGSQEWASQGGYGAPSYGGSQGGDSFWQPEASASTWKAIATYSVSYGSGSESWGGSGYNDCVQQCAAQYGGAPVPMAPSPTQEGSIGGGVTGNNGVTHTVIVAPSQGVLRYIPFSLNASVGDTVSFQWRAGPHTVSRSSALEICNKTSVDFFASGQQQKDFVFNEVVNDTKPIWIYCGVADHCQKGMFMGINIGQADPRGISGSSGSDFMPLSSMITNMTQMSSDMSAMWSYTKTQTGGNSYANGWGMSTNLAGMSQEAMMQTAQNVMYMQTLIAKNPDSVKDGQFLASNNMVLPMDLQQALASSPAGTTGTTGASGTSGGYGYGSSDAGASVAPASSTNAPSNAATSGAGSIASSSVAVGLVAVVATFFAL